MRPIISKRTGLFIVIGTIGCLWIICTDSSSLIKRAVSLERNWNLKEALRIHQKMGVKHHPDLVSHLRVLVKMGELYAAEQLVNSVEVQDSTHTKLDWMYEISKLYLFLGKDQKSYHLSKKIKKQAELEGNSYQLAKACYLLGRAAFNQARLDSAKIYFREGLRLIKAQESVDLKADILRQLGVLEWYATRYELALEVYYKPALALYKTSGNKLGEANIYANVGLIYRELGRHDKSIRYHVKALGIRKTIEDKMGLADSYYFLSNILSVPGWEGLFNIGLKKRSFALSTKIGYRWGAEVAARALLKEAKQFPYLVDDIDTLTATAFSYGEGKLYKKELLAKNYLKTQHYPEALKLAKKLIESHTLSKNFNSLLHAHFIYGTASVELKHFEEAEKHYQKILALLKEQMQPHPHPILQIKTKMSQADMYQEQGFTAQTKKILIDLIEDIDAFYLSYLNENPYVVFFNKDFNELVNYRDRAYQKIIALLTRERDTDVASFIIRQQLHYRWFIQHQKQGGHAAIGKKLYHQFINALNIAEAVDDSRFSTTIAALGEQILEAIKPNIQHYTAYPNGTNHRLNPFKTEEHIRQEVSEGDVFLCYYTNNDSSYVVGLTAEKERFYALDVSEKDIISAANVLRQTLLRGATYSADTLWKQPAKYLYDTLIEPVSKLFGTNGSDIGGIFIFSNHVFEGLPYSVLFDKQAGEFLIEQVIITPVTLSVSPVEKNHPNDVAKQIYTPPLKLSLLAMAPSINELPFTQLELEAMPIDRFESVRRYYGKKATFRQFTNQQQHFDIIHFAGHGSVDRNMPLASKLQFYDQSVAMVDILELNTKADLIVLSACETGLTNTGHATLPAVGLSHGFSKLFLHSGAHNVMATRWVISDSASSNLISTFYATATDTAIINSHPRKTSISTYRDLFAYALAQAQRGQIREGVHPYFWSGFFITGRL